MSSTVTDRRARIGVWCAAAAACALFATVFVPPLVERAAGGPSPLRLLFAAVCHQRPERSFLFLGAPLAVCARCTGLYLGGILGLAGTAWLGLGIERPVSRAVLGALVVPTLLDGLLAVAGLSPLGSSGRFALAVPTGAALGVLLAIGIHDLGHMLAGARPTSTAGRPAAEEWR